MIFLSVFRIYISTIVYMFVHMFLGLPVSIVDILPTFGCCIGWCKLSLRLYVFVCVCMRLYAFVCLFGVSADCWILGDLFQLFLFME